MKKFLAILLVLCVAATLLVGCGAKPASSAPVSTPESVSAPVENDGPVSLKVSWWGGDARHEATQAVLAAYTEANPNVTVNTNYGAWTGWEDAMSTALFAGTAEDLLQVNWNWIFNYDNKGETFVDLNTLADYIDLSQFDANALAQCTVDGRLSCIPVSMTGRIFYWNEASFEKAGIATPKSYDDLIAAGNIFKEKIGDDAYPLVLGEYDRMIFLVWALETKHGKDWVVDGKLNYTAEEIQEGMQIFLDLEEAHAIPSIKTIAGDGAESLDKNPKWMDGRYGGIFEWDSSAAKFSKALDENQKFVVGDYLTGFGDNKGGFTKVSLGFAISKTCEDPVAAAKLLNFMLNDPTGAEILNSQRGIPLSKAALEACNAKDLLNATTVEANGKVLANCSNKLDPTFEHADLKSTDGVYYDAMAGLSYGDYSLEEATQVLVDGINTVLAK